MGAPFAFPLPTPDLRQSQARHFPFPASILARRCADSVAPREEVDVAISDIYLSLI